MTEAAISPKRALFFRILLNRYHAGVGEAFLKNLPKEEVSEIFKQHIDSVETSGALAWTHDVLGRIHYSWLEPVIRKLPNSLQKPMVAAFSDHQSSKLAKLLDFELSSSKLAVPVKKFLLDQFFHYWQPLDALPTNYLPVSKLSPLLSLSKADLVKVIDLLALYDVAEALRHIVDKNKLKSIYRCLTNQQQTFLRTCLHKKERVTAPKLEIEKWDGDPVKFNLILHRRGMFRLSMALSGQAASFLWSVVHILDVGRGTAILKHYQATEVAGITPFMIGQVLVIIDFLKQKSDT